jgi:hypothetical protein
LSPTLNIFILPTGISDISPTSTKPIFRIS